MPPTILVRIGGHRCADTTGDVITFAWWIYPGSLPKYELESEAGRRGLKRRLSPSRKWPKAANVRILSQMIFVIASIGTAGIAPGTLHIQYQKIRARITRTGLRVKRRANSMG
jgi:hypothetical protein